MFDKFTDSYPLRKPVLHSPAPPATIETLPLFRSAEFYNLPLDRVHHLKETQVICGSTYNPIDVKSNGLADQLFYIFIVSGLVESHNTQTHVSTVLRAGSAGVITNHASTILKLGRGCRWLAFRVPLSLVRSQFGIWSRKFCFQTPKFSTVPDFHNHPVSGLYQTLELLLVKRGEGERSLLDASYEQLLMTQLYAMAPHNLNGGNASFQSPCPRQLRYAEDFMRNNLYVSIAINDIARAAGCSTRTLQRIFRHFRDATPIQILCRYRIAEAHDLMVSGKARTVTDVAANLQFSNPARFAVMYREAYGQKPSAVIRFYNAQ